MDFVKMSIKTEYRSLSDDIVREFYIPLLNMSTLYKRAVGFFSSTALIEISKGISGLVKNDGKIQLIVSPNLSNEDIEAINKGYKLRDEIIEKAIIEAFSPPQDIFEEERLNLLAHLIAKGHLDIKIAFMENKDGVGIFHEKMGLLYDKNNNVIAFSGSMNETKSAFSHNYESIDVFCSWTHDKERVYAKEKAFNMIWNDLEPNIRTIKFPDVAREMLDKYRKADVNLDIDREQFLNQNFNFNYGNIGINNNPGPKVPENITLHDYQVEAIENWKKQNYVGIFDMATGTGKTYTGLGAIAKLFQDVNGNLAVIIVCPYQHLVKQWVEDIINFGMKPIIGYSSSPQKNWKKRLEQAVTAFNLGIRNHFCFISTNATYSSSFVQEQINKLEGNVVLVVDEAHNFGSNKLSETLNPKIPYRLALSATLERHGDKEGTNKLLVFFGEKCIEYSLKKAIDAGKLTPYYYYPIVVNLTEDELLDYKAISAQIFKHCSRNSKGQLKISEMGKRLLIKRARLVAAAQQKISILKQIIEKKYKTDTHMLVYCGATTLEDPGYVEGKASLEEKRQIDIVVDMLGNHLGMRVSKFTSEETAEEREELIKLFSEGKHIQALIAIRCLDEGVNIPSIKTAFILASSTNPKEYIQRRGRVLRKYPGKDFARIYDFITLPYSIEEARNKSMEEIRSVRSLVNREMIRIKDFASIAENPSNTDSLINSIVEAYRLNEIEEVEYDF